MTKELKFVLLILAEVALYMLVFAYFKKSKPEIIFAAGAMTTIAMGLMNNLYQFLIDE